MFLEWVFWGVKVFKNIVFFALIWIRIKIINNFIKIKYFVIDKYVYNEKIKCDILI